MARVKAIIKYLLLLSVIAGITGCDAVTKHVATEALAGEPGRSYFFDIVRLSYAENPGSFLSLGAELPESVRFALFTIGTGVLLVFLIGYAVRSRRSGVTLFGLTMFLAGGVSNWVDRLADGRVVDFLNVGVGSVRTGIFNVADIAIVAGVIVLLAVTFSENKKQRHG